MKGHRRSLIALVFLAVIGQGLLFLHDLGHASPSDSADCLVCLKLDKQEHAVPAQSSPVYTDTGRNWPDAFTIPAPFLAYTGPQHSRAPPAIS